MTETTSKNRYHLLDSIRGLTLISMILYHGTWDLVYLYGVDWPWYHSVYAYIWQQSICWTFILLSGFCWSMGKHHWKRGCMVFGGGAIITLVTLIAMPENRVVFGVLTLLGSCMLLMIPLHKWMVKWKPWIGLTGSSILFFLTGNVNYGYLGFEGWRFLKLPKVLYQGYFATYIGFMDKDFYSTDYFPLLPWAFLFLMGYFLYQGLQKSGVVGNPQKLQTAKEDKKSVNRLEKLLQVNIKPLSFIGRHSLIIYMAHQAVLFVVLQTIFWKW